MQLVEEVISTASKSTTENLDVTDSTDLCNPSTIFFCIVKT